MQQDIYDFCDKIHSINVSVGIRNVSTIISEHITLSSIIKYVINEYIKHPIYFAWINSKSPFSHIW